MSEVKHTYEIIDIINEKLSGDSSRTAKDFVVFLREHNMKLESNGDGQGWAVGGVVGNSLGFMLVTGTDDMPGPWTVWFNSCDFGGDAATDELKETAWSHVSKCGKCHAGWENCGGEVKTIFGRDFERLCHSPLMFTNPDADTLTNLKKLMLMIK